MTIVVVTHDEALARAARRVDRVAWPYVVVVGAFAILGTFAGLQIDSLFVTAMLTVIGFSVHDTIVVFDRVRENLRTHHKPGMYEVLNRSLNETLPRLGESMPWLVSRLPAIENAVFGLVIILYVAIRMLYEGADAALFAHGLPEIPFIKGPPPAAPVPAAPPVPVYPRKQARH